jgi:hypothetical protein
VKGASPIHVDVLLAQSIREDAGELVVVFYEQNAHADERFAVGISLTATTGSFLLARYVSIDSLVFLKNRYRLFHAEQPMAHSVASSPNVSSGKLIAAIAAFVGLGIPLIAYIWETINRALSGHFQPVRVLISIGAIMLLLGVFKLASMTLTRWEGERK